MEQEIKLKIDGMHCDGCVRRVTHALNTTGGVQVNFVEIGSASVTVDFARVSSDKIEAALENIGFTAHVDSVQDGN
jgi:copper chaperone